MKKILVFLAVLLFAVVSAHAQDAKYGRQRAVLRILTDRHILESASDSLIKKLYSRGLENRQHVRESVVPSVFILVQIVDKKDRSVRFFRCTPAELYFLREQLRHQNIRILVDNSFFVGFTKLV